MRTDFSERTHRQIHTKWNDKHLFNIGLLLCKFNDSAQKLRHFRKECSFSFLELMGGWGRFKRRERMKGEKTINTLFVYTFSAGN